MLPKDFFCTNWRAIRFVYTNSTLSIEKPYATVAWSWYWVILHGVIRLWRHGANGPQFFSDHLLDVAFNQWIRVQSWIKSWWLKRYHFTFLCDAFKSPYTALRLIENDVSFVWMGPLGMDFPLIILNKWNLPNSTSIDHNSLACCFFS